MEIEIRELRGIKHLEFELPKRGVWLLTGQNGSGKTSLLAVLHRIRNGRSFADHFRVSENIGSLDSYKDTKIFYKIEDEQVQYSYRGMRWRPIPRSGANLLRKFPYSDSLYILANSDRIEPFADEIQPKYILSVSTFVKEFMTTVLSDQKWEYLRKVNTRRGVGSTAYLVARKVQGRNHYYSEKNFSLGELCILRLALKLESIRNNSLILIDEIEMALHPKAQINLLRKLEEIAKEKSLTVILSTHSSSLIKNIDRRRLLFLYSEENRIVSKKGVYPAIVLGELAYDEELHCDIIFFVEDEQAKLLLKEIISEYQRITPGKPLMYRIVPIGGWPQVLSFTKQSTAIVPSYIKRHAFLDLDVQSEGIPDARRKKLDTATLYDEIRKSVSFLPCTPEVGIIEYLENLSVKNSASLNIEVDGNTILLGNIISGTEYSGITGDKERDVCKKKLNHIADRITEQYSVNQVLLRSCLYKMYVQSVFMDKGKLKALLGPIF